MLNKFKFIPLILISLVTFSFAVRIPLSSSSYDYRFKISTAGDMWLYNGVVDGIVEHCQYTQIENNAYAQPNFNESFKKDSFYAQSDPASKSPNGYFDDPATIYKFLGSETYEGSVSFKHETYSWAKKPDSIQKICVQCNTKVGEYFDSTTGLCVNKCEDITNRSDRLNCMCKRAGKLGFSGHFSSSFIGGDGSGVCWYTCTTTKDDPEARPNGDGTEFSVSYDIDDTYPNANGFCFADDTYAPNAKPGPNPKPDDPGNNNGTKPGGDNPKPDDPGNNNGTKPGNPDNNNGTKPGGGGGKPSNPGNNNGAKPGNPDNNNGTKPGDDDNGKFDFSKLNELNETVEGGTNKFMKIFEDAKDQIVGAYNRLKKGQLSDFKVHGSVNSCPYTRDFIMDERFSKKITIDICAFLKDARPFLYFIFYALFLFLFSLFTYKAVARLL
ncbi:hypothetical protein [uncultured Campylobacter sp.]|uniref:hypothetical protein n=1 Tax=uncultured Campylobacter sp. TaxID=218934 RepID=UPI002622E8FE|nr:hypothetical protein [uncultured Campylobacter sp.]